ncbi:MAG: flagellar biosynthesis anti-sigma factor FlgM [Pseudomonadota bacterium]
MSTKIDGVSPGQVSQSISQARDNVAQRNERGGQTTSGGTAESTRVDLTSNAVLLGKLDQALAGVPEVDAKRVEAIKSAIADGSYQVDADKVAAALLKLDVDIDPTR